MINLNGLNTKSLSIFLEQNSTWEPMTGCLLWTGQTIHTGYGRFKSQEINKHILAHRASYLVNFGFIPSGLKVLHRCDIPQCINPFHLFLGTQKENMVDMYAKKRDNHAKGVSVNTAKLTESDVRYIRLNYKRYSKEFGGVPLAKKFNICKDVLHDLLKYRTWKHI